SRAEDFALQGYYAREASRKLGVDEAGFLHLINKYIRERLGKEVRVQEREALMKEREHLEPPAETDQAVEDPLLGRNEEVNQEWVLIRLLIEHGQKTLRDQGPVSEFIAQSVDSELIRSSEVSRLYRSYYSQLEAEGKHPDPSFFSNHPEEGIRKRIASLLHARHEISPNWKEVYGI